MSVIDSHSNLMYSAQNYGTVSRNGSYYLSASTTAAVVTCGYTTIQRYPFTINIFGGTAASPSLGTGVTGGYMTYFRALNEDTNTHILCGIEYELAYVTANGSSGTFTDGTALPTKNIRFAGADNSMTVAPLALYAVVSTVMVGAGSYTLTITYANQDGTGSRTATMVIPNVSAVNSAFDILPHLQAGDTSVTDITNITLTGTSGVVKIKAVFPTGFSLATGIDDSMSYNDPLTNNLPMYPIANTDVLAFYRIGANTTNCLVYNFTIVADY